MDSIFASATPINSAERSILRCSGIRLFEKLSSWQKKYVLKPNLQFNRGRFRLKVMFWPEFECEVQVQIFCAPASATGEDCLEFHMPGNSVLMMRLQQQLKEFGLRGAEPGEFTRRAYLNNKVDLIQAQAVLELIESRTSSSAKAAAQLLSGEMSTNINQIREDLKYCLVQLEAGLDFQEGDSQDLMPYEINEFVNRAVLILERIRLSEEQRYQRVQSKFRCALIGPANAGKSSLFKSLTGKSVLISSSAGTTRDWREGLWEDCKEPYEVIDLPGLGGEFVDERDNLARKLAKEEISADLWLLVVRPDQTLIDFPKLPIGPKLVVFSHADILGAPHRALLLELHQRLGKFDSVCIDTRSVDSLKVLKKEVDKYFLLQEQQIVERIHCSERYQEAFASAKQAVLEAQSWLNHGSHLDLVAGELRYAVDVLQELIGVLTPEEILDQLFASFCVGK